MANRSNPFVASSVVCIASPVVGRGAKVGGTLSDTHRVSSDGRRWAREHTPHLAVMCTPGCAHQCRTWCVPASLPERRASIRIPFTRSASKPQPGPRFPLPAGYPTQSAVVTEARCAAIGFIGAILPKWTDGSLRPCNARPSVVALVRRRFRTRDEVRRRAGIAGILANLLGITWFTLPR
jgi:hypothetical protein